MQIMEQIRALFKVGPKQSGIDFCPMWEPTLFDAAAQVRDLQAKRR